MPTSSYLQKAQKMALERFTNSSADEDDFGLNLSLLGTRREIFEVEQIRDALQNDLTPVGDLYKAFTPQYLRRGSFRLDGKGRGISSVPQQLLQEVVELGILVWREDGERDEDSGDTTLMDAVIVWR